MTDNDYELVWTDEFDNDGAPNPANWMFEEGFVRNNEQQWYQPENAWCENGLLVIEGRREQRPNPLYKPGSDNWKEKREHIRYTASCLKTKGLHEWKYGRFEMRGRIPTGSGLWPAWWTLGNARPWPGNGEVDILEYYRGTHLANVIWAGSPGGKGKIVSGQHPITKWGGADWAKEFHTWRMDWDENEIALYLDDELQYRADVDTLFNDNEERTNPFREPHFMLLNLAIGGNQGGGKDGGGERLPGGNPDETEFPVRFEIDYVRVYQKRS